jgi:uncharacterized protein (UPF0335 family)
MSAFLEGLGKVFGKVADQFQSRIERLKNEKAKLLIERKKLLSGSSSAPASFRLIKLDIRLRQINEALSNNAKD